MACSTPTQSSAREASCCQRCAAYGCQTVSIGMGQIAAPLNWMAANRSGDALLRVRLAPVHVEDVAEAAGIPGERAEREQDVRARAARQLRGSQREPQQQDGDDQSGEEAEDVGGHEQVGWRGAWQA